jgi:hypothetical protein
LILLEQLIDFQVLLQQQIFVNQDRLLMMKDSSFIFKCTENKNRKKFIGAKELTNEISC